MLKSEEFLMPEYFTEFKCKMGKCRFSCCEGWPVTFSLEDYFRLSSGECSKELREKIDRGVKVCLQPTPDAYAQVQHDYYGNCPMRLSDGRCAIHAEMGENALAQICKLYPRGIRTKPDCECSCSNSCEGVLELLFAKDEPIRFVRKTLCLDLPEYSDRTFDFQTFGKEQEIRFWIISILQDRSKSLPNRLMTLGLALKDMESAFKSKNAESVNALFNKSYVLPINRLEISAEHLTFGIDTAEELLKLIDERSNSVCSYGKEALDYFGKDEGTLIRYETAKQKFEDKINKWEIWFEHMLVNHVFFEQFPFQDRPEGPWEEFVAICSVYALLRFLGIGWMAHKKETTDFTDMAAAIFRLVDHTDFDRYASHTLRDLGCNTPQKVFDLIML